MIIDPIALGTSGQLAPVDGGDYCPAPLTLGSSGQIVADIVTGAITATHDRFNDLRDWIREEDEWLLVVCRSLLKICR